MAAPDAEDGDNFEGILFDGNHYFKHGNVMGLLLHCDAGTLTVKKNGVRLGVAATVADRPDGWLTGPWC
jgi:hypothetical protein